MGMDRCLPQTKLFCLSFSFLTFPFVNSCFKGSPVQDVRPRGPEATSIVRKKERAYFWVGFVYPPVFSLLLFSPADHTPTISHHLYEYPWVLQKRDLKVPSEFPTPIFASWFSSLIRKSWNRNINRISYPPYLRNIGKLKRQNERLEGGEKVFGLRLD